MQIVIVKQDLRQQCETLTCVTKYTIELRFILALKAFFTKVAITNSVNIGVSESIWLRTGKLQFIRLITNPTFTGIATGTCFTNKIIDNLWHAWENPLSRREAVIFERL